MIRLKLKGLIGSICTIALIVYYLMGGKPGERRAPEMSSVSMECKETAYGNTICVEKE